ncbi:MAG TPA: hypothetical protein VK508_06680, partial [Cyclobacteriaceae bacterium]|nr:hypothetical protein [Cyclobacteriaceae bacterium]
MRLIYKVSLLLLFITGGTQIFAQSNQVADIIELGALKAIWENAGGASWTTKTNWPTTGNWPASATATEMDAWYGIVVVNGDITQVILNANNLNGRLPDQLGDLKELKLLSVFDNNLSGQIPARLGECTKVLQLLLYGNKFSGSIPESFRYLTSMSTLYLHTNLLSGVIPSTFSSLTNLVHLDLHGNELTGPVPSIFSSMTQLYTLNLSYNRLTGSLPALRGSAISLSNNMLSGELTVVSGSAVYTLDASNNKFTSVGNSLASPPILQVLNMMYNELVSISPWLLTKANRGILQVLFAANRLDFATLEPYTTAGFNPASAYVGQYEIVEVTQKAITFGSPFTLTARPLGTYTSITWEKQNSSGTWVLLTNDEDAVARTYTRNSSTAADEGTYRWKTTSTKFSTAAIVSGPIQVKSSIQLALDNWGFQYKYDSRKRMTQKKVPGADWVYLVYDDRDRL